MLPKPAPAKPVPPGVICGSIDNNIKDSREDACNMPFNAAQLNANIVKYNHSTSKNCVNGNSTNTN